MAGRRQTPIGVGIILDEIDASSLRFLRFEPLSMRERPPFWLEMARRSAHASRSTPCGDVTAPAIIR
jgi:hypothetical protein